MPVAVAAPALAAVAGDFAVAVADLAVATAGLAAVAAGVGVVWAPAIVAPAAIKIIRIEDFIALFYSGLLLLGSLSGTPGV
jgi:hypothetical protein